MHGVNGADCNVRHRRCARHPIGHQHDIVVRCPLEMPVAEVHDAITALRHVGELGLCHLADADAEEECPLTRARLRRGPSSSSES